MKILIVGAGIGGLSLGGFLEKFGIEYTIIEKQKDQSHHGFSLGMWNNGRKILAKLGLEDQFDRSGVPLKFLKICNGEGWQVYKYDLSHLTSMYGSYLHIKRSELITWLSDLIPKEKIQFGLTVETIDDRIDGVEVTLSNGTKEKYDLVVGADGISSHIRELAFKGDYRKFTNWRAWYMWTEKKFVEPHTITNYLEPKAYVVTFDEGNRALAVFVAHTDHKIWDTEEHRIEHLTKLFENEKCIDPEIFAGHTDADFLPTDLSEIRMDHMYKGPVVLLGDAAHGFEPFAGIGGSMALEDAYVLASEILKATNASLPVEASLKEYEYRRKKRVQLARQVTERMMLWATVESSLIRRLINKALPYIPNRFFIRNYAKLFREGL